MSTWTSRYVDSYIGKVSDRHPCKDVPNSTERHGNSTGNDTGQSILERSTGAGIFVVIVQVPFASRILSIAVLRCSGGVGTYSCSSWPPLVSPLVVHICTKRPRYFIERLFFQFSQTPLLPICGQRSVWQQRRTADMILAALSRVVCNLCVCR